MPQIVIPATVVAMLRSAGRTVELVSEDGYPLGRFTPKFSPDEWDGLEPPISDAEIEARLSEGPGRPLADILADLAKRA